MHVSPHRTTMVLIHQCFSSCMRVVPHILYIYMYRITSQHSEKTLSKGTKPIRGLPATAWLQFLHTPCHRGNCCTTCLLLWIHSSQTRKHMHQSIIQYWESPSKSANIQAFVGSSYGWILCIQLFLGIHLDFAQQKEHHPSARSETSEPLTLCLRWITGWIILYMTRCGLNLLLKQYLPKGKLSN